MERDRLHAVNRCIRDAAQQAAAPGGLSAVLIERFLRTGEETWEGAGSGQFSLAQFKEDEAYTRATKTALRNLLDLLANLLPAEARAMPPVPAEAIRQRIDSMVTGLVPGDWREVALREITARLEFCILRQRFCPFHKGLEDFSGVRIQGGVAENPLLPGRVT